MDWSSYKSASCLIFLCDMQSIVKHSFLAHNSVSYLDLSLCEDLSTKSEKNKLVYTERILGNLKLNRSHFCCTAEGSKKNFAKNRSLLYTYHLDVSAELEGSQRNIACNYNESSLAMELACNYYGSSLAMEFACNYNGIVINGIVIPYGLYERCLHEMIVAKLFKTQEVKFVRSIFKVMEFVNLPGNWRSLLNRCLEILYSQCSDSDIINEYSVTACLEESDMFFLKPKILEFFLSHTDCRDYNGEEFHRRQEWINCCIFSCKFENVAPLLKFYNVPRFSESAYNKLKSSLRIGSGLTLNEMEMPVEQGWITKERNLLVLQILDFFYGMSFSELENSSLLTSGSEALRMVWRSIPDILISLEELVLLYRETRIWRDIKRIHHFYSNIIQEEVLAPQPRKLKDHCRITIRKILSENQRLPEGIGQLGLSPLVQSFLKLEQTWL